LRKFKGMIFSENVRDRIVAITVIEAKVYGLIRRNRFSNLRVLQERSPSHSVFVPKTQGQTPLSLSRRERCRHEPTCSGVIFPLNLAVKSTELFSNSLRDPSARYSVIDIRNNHAQELSCFQRNLRQLKETIFPRHLY